MAVGWLVRPAVGAAEGAGDGVGEGGGGVTTGLGDGVAVAAFVGPGEPEGVNAGVALGGAGVRGAGEGELVATGRGRGSRARPRRQQIDRHVLVAESLNGTMTTLSFVQTAACCALGRNRDGHLRLAGDRGQDRAVAVGDRATLGPCRCIQRTRP